MANKGDVLLGEDGGQSTDAQAELEDAERTVQDSEELRALVSEGREQGYLTFEHIAKTLEEVEVSKERRRRGWARRTSAGSGGRG